MGKAVCNWRNILTIFFYGHKIPKIHPFYYTYLQIWSKNFNKQKKWLVKKKTQ